MKKLTLPLIVLAIFTYLFLTNVEPNTSRYPLGVDIPEGFPSVGIDISHHQGSINWDTVRYYMREEQLIHFIYMKATEGQQHVDREWLNNRQMSIETGIKHGAYHFFLNQVDPKAQAMHFLQNYRYRSQDLPPALDVENEAHFQVEPVRIWLETVEADLGVRPIIYTSLAMYQRYFQDDFHNYRFWIASYSRRPAIEDDSRIIHWQFSERGRFPGHHGNFDLNVSRLNF
jgi:lysozyme